MANDVDDRKDLQEDVVDHDSPLFKLRFISYGNIWGPIERPPDSEQLDFPLNTIPNPPANLRKTHTGLSAHLREAVLSEEGVAERSGDIVTIVQSKMDNMKRAWEQDQTSPTTLIVALSCGRGKHRSVTFAEELPKHIETDGWSVTVWHRDLAFTSDQADQALSDEEDGSDSLSDQSLDREGLEAKGKEQHKQKRRKSKPSAEHVVHDSTPDGEIDLRRDGSELMI